MTRSPVERFVEPKSNVCTKLAGSHDIIFHDPINLIPGLIGQDGPSHR